MSRLSIVWLALACATLAAGQTSSPNGQSAFRISGTVVNAVTGQSLSNVEVSIGPAEGQTQARSVHTSADGHFNFEGLTRQKYWLAARGHGFSLQRFNQHGDFSTAIAVGPEKDSENLTFRLYPDATIVGTITDDQSDPVAGAQVMLFRTGVQDGENSTRMRARAMADDQGRYHLAHVPEGSYYIAVSATPWYAQNDSAPRRASFGAADQMSASNSEVDDASQFDVAFPLTFYPGVTDSTAATPIAVKPGERLIADVNLSPVPALHVRLSDFAMEPQTPGSRLSPVPLSANLNQKIFGVTLPVSTRFQALGPGLFEINGVPPGNFLLTVQKFGKDPASHQEQIEVSDNSELDAADAAGLASISGVLELDSGQPASRPMVVLLTTSSGENLSTQSSAKGEFHFESVPPEKYDLSVFGQADTFVKNIAATGANVIGREIEVGTDTAIQMKVTLSKGVGRINGTALHDGKPFAGAMIVLVPQDVEHNTSLVRRDQSDSDGTFSLYNVLPGSYTVVAVQNGWGQQWLSPAVLQPLLTRGEVVNVSAREKYQIKVNVQ